MTGVCDYLVGDQTHVYLANVQFDVNDGKHRVVDESTHLRGGKAGLLESSWTQADLALRKSIQDWRAHDSVGQLLAFGDGQTVGFQFTEDELGALFATGDRKWSQAVISPQLALALVANYARIAITGANERFRTSAGGFLAIRRVDDGRLCGDTFALPSPPVLDGLALAGGRIYVSLQDGSVVALGP